MLKNGGVMLKTSRAKHNSHHDLYNDLAKFKAIVSNTAFDMKDTAGDILSDSLNVAKKKSIRFKKNIAAYAYKKPIQILGISFLAGLCMGFLVKKR
jgi:hypothetical protein